VAPPRGGGLSAERRQLELEREFAAGARSSAEAEPSQKPPGRHVVPQGGCDEALEAVLARAPNHPASAAPMPRPWTASATSKATSATPAPGR
jgi:hypothetical protein